MLTLVTSCGFSPVYKEKSDGTVMFEQASSIEVANIPDRDGQILKAAIEDVLNPTNKQAAKKYRLEINLTKEEVPFLIERNRRVTRYNVVYVATFRLLDKDTIQPIHSGASKMVASYDAADSEFSVYVAEEDTSGRILKEMAHDINFKLNEYFLRK